MIRKSSKNVLAVLLVLCISAVALFTAFSGDVLVPEVAGTTEATTEAPIEDTTVAEETTAPVEPSEEPSSEEPSSDVPEDESTTEQPGTVVGVVGDVNQDDRITSADARLALRICVQLEEPTELQLVLADANGDKVLRTADARLILRHAVQLSNEDVVNVIGNNVRLIEGESAGVTIVVDAD